MNPDNDSTPLSREFGLLLRDLREQADYKGMDLAKKIKWWPAKVSRAETGKLILNDIEVTTWAVFCGAVGQQLADILNMGREVQNDYTVKPHAGQLPDMLRQLVIEESSAAHITEFEPIYIPGLAQTEDYVRAVLRSGQPDATSEYIEEGVLARTGRQGVLKRTNPVHCAFVVHEQALRMRVGTARIMSEQMLHLLFLCDRPQCEIRVVPTRAGAIGMAPHAFRIMRYVDHAPVVYVNTLAATMFHHDKAELDAYGALLAKIERVALDVAQSRDLITRVASEFEVMGDDADG
jgi:hypothetical protein